ncbi:penicillin-binding protein [Amycolatopsis deserti]|uniref:Penicillin-binding protein n=1 Tax=Amycolatopsis deserti TaxID=185696 RepID=A0ABQ3IN83_9PSEU|nr:penicillin-binding transpeptidase domain-containing protein [Amycolatopsis deserti]GHE87296.1 penicillin-binding protein [Amycolatopsis deserti]
MLAGGAAAVVAIVAAAVVVVWGGSSPEKPQASGSGAADSGTVASEFLRAFAEGNADAAAALTDDPRAASVLLADARRGLAPVSVSARLGQVTPGATRATAAFQVGWTIAAGQVWSYDNTLDLVAADGRWLVHWSPAVVHPKLRAGQQLAVRTRAGKVAVADRNGRPVLTWQAAGTRAAEPGAAPLLPALQRTVAERSQGGWSVVSTDLEGVVQETLFGQGDVEVPPLTTTLSLPAQAAAQRAVDSAASPAMLVAIQPSTGDLLAVAQNAAAGTEPKALNGLYAPGSTFKIATAAALLESGTATADTVADCPATARIGQRTIPNDDEFSFPPLPLHSAFAHSCNTTFAQLASTLPADALAEAASGFGLNADFTIPGITTEAGKVVPGTSGAEQVESAIGQGTVQASPFGLALMAATVARGDEVTPRLWQELETVVNTGYRAPSREVIAALRTMMREVVTGGTATGLRGNGAVYGKTGTAQFGDGSRSNGWFAGYRDDVAFAVLLLGSDSSKPAVTVSSVFLGALG